MEKLHLRVNDPAGLKHSASGQWLPGKGEYDFLCEPEYRGWLDGHVAAGRVEILTRAEDPSAPANERAPGPRRKSDGRSAARRAARR